MKKGIVVFALLFVVLYVRAQVKPKSGSAQAKPSPAVALKASIDRGKLVYNTYCLSCHQLDGGGVPHLNPPLIKTKWVLGDKKTLAGLILKGFNEPIEIGDEEYHNPMPPQPYLTDQQIADVLTYVRNSFGNKASMVTAAEVKAVRATIKK